MKTSRIRTATSQDSEQWLAMRKALWPDCPDNKHTLEMEQLLSSQGIVFVAEHKDAGLIGFAEISIRNEHVPGASTSPIPYVEGWYVDNHFRGIGIGHSLLAAAEQWAKQRGFAEIASDTEFENSSSIAIHTAMGFKEVERSVHFLKSL